LVHELKTFVYNAQKKKAEATRGKHDDAIMASCFALHIRDEQMRGIPVGADVPEEMTKIFKSEMYAEIRKEIMEGSKKDWMMDESDDPLMISSDSEDFLAPVTFDIKRKHDKLLKEFGW
jgi:sRNA-binding carbon storage regulator CsrA